MRTSASAVLMITAVALFTSAALAQQAPAGRVLWVKGEAERRAPDGRVHRLAKGDVITEGDTLRTGPDAHVQLSMSDDALLALRPGTTLRLADFRYQGAEDGSEHAVFELVRGGLRSITGAIGRTHKENLQLRTKTTLIGVRGTDHEAYFIPEGSNAGTYDRVTSGGTYLQDSGGRVDLNPGQSGYAPLAGGTPARLDRTPAFMQLASLRDTGLRSSRVREESSGDEARLRAPRGVPHNDGAIPSGRRSLPHQATIPVPRAQALGENAGKGWGRGGRCGGSCADLVRDGNR